MSEYTFYIGTKVMYLVCNIHLRIFKNKPKPKLKEWLYALVGTFIFAFLLINLPEDLLKEEDNKYYFTDRGYYEKYGEEYEKNNNLKYTIDDYKN